MFGGKGGDSDFFFSLIVTSLVQKHTQPFALWNCSCLFRAEEPFYISSEGGSYTFFQAEHNAEDGRCPSAQYSRAKGGPHGAGLGLLTHIVASAGQRGHCLESFCCITQISTCRVNIYLPSGMSRLELTIFLLSLHQISLAPSVFLLLGLQIMRSPPAVPLYLLHLLPF